MNLVVSRASLAAAPPRPRQRGSWWPTAIVGLLSMNIAIVGATVFFAVSDPSVAVEPNYYEKAVRWDESASSSARSASLGWTGEISCDRPASASPTEVTLRLADRNGAPVTDASVDAVVFHHARSGARQTATFVEREPGVYVAAPTLSMHGLWRFRLTARRGGDVFTLETDHQIAGAIPHDPSTNGGSARSPDGRSSSTVSGAEARK